MRRAAGHGGRAAPGQGSAIGVGRAHARSAGPDVPPIREAHVVAEEHVFASEEPSLGTAGTADSARKRVHVGHETRQPLFLQL